MKSSLFFLFFVAVFAGLGETRSVIKAPDDICSQSPDGGPCRAYFPQYYYDKKDQKCKTFVYGGCLGNANRFSDKQECEQACGRNCDMMCTLDYKPVCGSNGVTYPNECALEAASCKSNDKISLDHEGRCDQKRQCDKVCLRIYQPVCGSDGKTYSNKCVMEVAACTSGENISVEHDGECEEKQCDKICPKIYRPVCGSDGKTYSNKCVMKVAACTSGENISLEHDGECEE